MKKIILGLVIGLLMMSYTLAALGEDKNDTSAQCKIQLTSKQIKAAVKGKLFKPTKVQLETLKTTFPTWGGGVVNIMGSHISKEGFVCLKQEGDKLISFTCEEAPKNQ